MFGQLRYRRVAEMRSSLFSGRFENLASQALLTKLRGLPIAGT